MKRTILPLFVVLLLACGCSKPDSGANSGQDVKCAVCHEFPPKDRVHAAHVGRRGYECALCHKGYPLLADGDLGISDSLHRNGRADIAFSTDRFPLQKAVYDSVPGRCSSVYCHGFFEGGDSAEVTIKDEISAGTCGSCHNIRLMESAGHLPHTPGNVSIGLAGLVTGCGTCHDGYSLADSTVNTATHLDGMSGPVDPARCAACHAGLPATHDAAHEQCVLCHAR